MINNLAKSSSALILQTTDAYTNSLAAMAANEHIVMSTRAVFMLKIDTADIFCKFA